MKPLAGRAGIKAVHWRKRATVTETQRKSARSGR
jgi:hypothetical protein